MFCQSTGGRAESPWDEAHALLQIHVCDHDNAIPFLCASVSSSVKREA